MCAVRQLTALAAVVGGACATLSQKSFQHSEQAASVWSFLVGTTGAVPTEARKGCETLELELQVLSPVLGVTCSNNVLLITNASPAPSHCCRRRTTIIPNTRMLGPGAHHREP